MHRFTDFLDEIQVNFRPVSLVDFLQREALGDLEGMMKAISRSKISG